MQDLCFVRILESGAGNGGWPIQHRSGAYGTLGAMKEGNNANVIGIRQRF